MSPAPPESSAGDRSRDALLERLEAYRREHPSDETCPRIIRFAERHDDCLWRTCRPGHITASAWVIDREGERALLTHHRKLGRWLQLGGHVDGDGRVELAALREVEEESGLSTLRLVSASRDGADPVVPLDVDIHPIPARGTEPEHDHLDIRYLMVCDGAEPLVVSSESIELAWVPFDRLRDYTDEESVLRLADRARSILGR